MSFPMKRLLICVSPLTCTDTSAISLVLLLCTHVFIPRTSVGRALNLRRTRYIYRFLTGDMNGRRSAATGKTKHNPEPSDATDIQPRQSEHASSSSDMSNKGDVKPSVTPPPDEYHESFNDPDGDVVLKTSDGVKLRTYALILRLSSSVFQSMLERPKASERGAQGQIILSLDEDAVVIVNALTMVSGKAFPTDIVRP